MAVPLLERASALTPDDHAIRLALAEALKRADRLDEARTVLRTVITTFGRRRPKSRANVHYQLARLELVDGDAPSALVELETAAAIDQENQAILRALAEAARDAGQFERAEKAYRALLDVLRRREEVGQARVMPRSEVLLELHSLAEHQGNSTRAHEILESALEMSAREDVDGARANNGHGTHGVPETIDLE